MFFQRPYTPSLPPHRVPHERDAFSSTGRLRPPCAHPTAQHGDLRAEGRRVFLCRMIQKAPKRLAVMLNSPYLCITHLQIEGVSGLDRLDAASSPAFFGSRAEHRVSAQSNAPHFFSQTWAPRGESSRLSVEIPPFCRPLLPRTGRRGRNSAVLSAPRRWHTACKYQGVRLAGAAHRAAHRPRKGFAPERHTERRTTTHSFSKQQKNKTYNYGKDYRN